MLRRRPIARTVARTAVVAGTATVVAGGVRRHQDPKSPRRSRPRRRPRSPKSSTRKRPPCAGGRDVTGSDRTAQAARRAEGTRNPHRGRVRGGEGEDPRHVTPRSRGADQRSHLVPEAVKLLHLVGNRPDQHAFTPACANADSFSANISGGPIGSRSRSTSSGRCTVGITRSLRMRSASFRSSVM